MKSSGVILVMPGTILTCSQPKIRNKGQSRSANSVANTVVPSDVCGAIFLAARASPKCPRNMQSRLGVQAADYKRAFGLMTGHKIRVVMPHRSHEYGLIVRCTQTARSTTPAHLQRRP